MITAFLFRSADPISAAKVPLILSRLRENNRDGRENATNFIFLRLDDDATEGK